MNYKSISCDSVVKKITKKDSLFHGDYCVDPYQNCEFGCHYCDSSFEKTVFVKTNVVDILKRELEQIEHGRIILGSVHDPYQNAERNYELTKTILQTLQEFDFPCHILTKSPLVLRDIDILTKLDSMVTISMSSLDSQVLHIFEPEVPSPNERFKTIQTLYDNEITTGLALIPLLPFIVEYELEDLVKAARQAHAQYLIHKHLELKGDQERLYRNLIETHYPHLLPKYDALYENDFKPNKSYIQEFNSILSGYCKKYKISERINC